MAGPPRTKDEGGVGCAIGDYDNDGNLDIFVPNYGHNQLYRNNGNGTFTDVARQTVGLAVENHAVGSDWGDYDNDGDLDLSVISYVGAVGAQTPMNALFRNDGAKGFVNLLTKDSPLNKADHASQFVDYDNDGGIDLSITDGYGPVGGHFVFRNTLPAEVKKRSLERDRARQQGPSHAVRRRGAAVQPRRPDRRHPPGADWRRLQLAACGAGPLRPDDARPGARRGDLHERDRTEEADRGQRQALGLLRQEPGDPPGQLKGSEVSVFTRITSRLEPPRSACS